MHYEKFSDGSIKCIEKELPFTEPKGWSWTRLGNVGCYKKGPFGSSITKAMFVPESDKAIKVYEQKNAINKDATIGKYYISEEKFESLKSFEVFPNDIIVSCAGTIGEAFVLPHNMRKGIINQALMKISLYDITMLDFYLIYFDLRLKVTAQEQGHGSALKNIPPFDKLKKYLIPIPPAREQERIVKTVKRYTNIISEINHNKTDISILLEKTKSKILDLAIRGKLVPQDPKDEPAKVLLERIRKEKEDLIKAGKLKRDKRESIIFRGDDNSYYLRTGKLVEPLTDWNFDDLPKNWEICCFGEICNYGDCINVESSLIENGAWILDLEDIEKDTGRILSRISKEDRQSISTKHKFNKGQVLYSKLRPYLNKVVLADQDGYCTSEILPLEFHSVITPEYARYYLMSPTFLRYADKCSYGVKMPRLGTNDGKKAIFPLPPINEQRRIVKQIEFMFSHLSDIETRVQ